MTKKTPTTSELISRISRAPNVSLLVDAYDAAIEDSIVSVHRVKGTEWQVWHGGWSGFSGDFFEVRAHLAEDAEEILDRAAAAEIGSAPAMIQQQAQQQQACAAVVRTPSKVEVAKAEVARLEARCAVLREEKLPAYDLLRECRAERISAVSGELDACPGVCWTNEERAEVAAEEADARLDECIDDHHEACLNLREEQDEDDAAQACADLLDMIEGTEHLQSLVQASVDRAAAGLGSTTATQDSVEALRLHAADLRRQLAAMPMPVPMIQQVAQQQQANAGARLTVITNPTPPTHCSCCGRRLTDHVSVRHGIGPICRANSAAPTRDLFTTRSDYTVEDLLDVVLVVDLDRGGRSVSNDASGVIDDLRKAGLIRPGVPVVYRDSSGTWDQLRVKEGRFSGFSSVGVLTREEAIAWARAN
ncbi:hypothetical protein SAMN05216360_102471 [Methylobacterium phyllostachyos]|uniref:Uncharacterized protein n=1 Tax=Methylobacterium phyllostachyos TaxID=582672 RepID=A0A1G9UAZ0_9HYPH|nr:DUF6011 domain-containing protein [Methylobacterium phyllostachyos]SDM57012.1 hypothetical protein SAMN05216360_102471 [Methylobacterium phyllostachyos]